MPCRQRVRPGSVNRLSSRGSGAEGSSSRVLHSGSRIRGRILCFSGNVLFFGLTQSMQYEARARSGWPPPAATTSHRSRFLLQPQGWQQRHLQWAAEYLEAVLLPHLQRFFKGLFFLRFRLGAVLGYGFLFSNGFFNDGSSVKVQVGVRVRAQAQLPVPCPEQSNSRGVICISPNTRSRVSLHW